MKSPRAGRPPSDNPKNNQHRIRLTDKEVKMLEFCCNETGLSKSDVVRRGIEIVHNELQTIMADHQYDSIIKMVLKIVQKSKDKDEAEAELKDLLKGKDENENSG